MEQQPGDINWPPRSPQPAEGAMRLWAHQAVAHGGDAVVYFRWRRCRQGQEQYHAGLRRQDGSADRAYHAADRAADELFDLDPVEPTVALVHDYESLWATGYQPHSPDWDYWDHLRTYYDAVRARGRQVDVVPPSADLRSYDAVVVPTLYLVDDEGAAVLEDYVESGGHLLLGARSGAKDRHNQLHETLAPGPLTELAGLEVERHETLAGDMTAEITYEDATYAYRTWASWLAETGGTAVGTYETGEATGRSAVVRNEHGNGTVTYCGCWPGADLADAIVTSLLDDAGVAYTERLPDGVRVAERDGVSWVLNFTGNSVTLQGTDEAAFTIGGPTVAPFDLAVLDQPAHSISLR